jgi:drug/metabolite transporter, DME family
VSAAHLPIVLALAAAFLMAVGAHCQNMGLADVASRRGTAIAITAAAAFHWILSPFFLVSSQWLEPAVLIFVLAGIIRPSVSANLSVAGTRFLGPTLSSTLGSTTPLFGAALGIFWLGEAFTVPIAVGTLGIIAAVLMLSLGNLKMERDWPMWALALPVGAAIIRSLAHVLTKVGMEDIPNPYFAGLVGFTVSAILTNIALGWGEKRVRVDWKARGTYWFAAAGVVFAIAIMSLNNGLMRGEITAVMPIIGLSPIFAMLLSIFVFKRERLTLRVVMAVFIVVPSVAFIAIYR